MNVWLDGRLLPAGEARIDPADRGFLLGDGVFETILVSQGRPQHLDRHLARLRLGAAVLGIGLAWSDTALAEAAGAVIGAEAQAVLRLTLSRGPAPRGVLPPSDGWATLLMTRAPLPAPQPPGRAVVAHGTRRNEWSPLSRIKSLNYLDSILARQEAAARGADEAILLNTAGDVAEASAGNLFVLVDGEWITPRVEDGALPGIARALLLEAGWAQEARVSVDTLTRAEGAVVTSSLGRRDLVQIEGSSSFLKKRTKKLLAV